MHKHNGILGNLDVLFGLIYKCYILLNLEEKGYCRHLPVCACDDYIEYLTVLFLVRVVFKMWQDISNIQVSDKNQVDEDNVADGYVMEDGVEDSLIEYSAIEDSVVDGSVIEDKASICNVYKF